jgi:flavin reductase (DIM6/NTAB) family NADH-FMN oxidoreductase RutF
VQRKNGEMKDTARNAIATGELVVHIVDESNVEAINQTAATLPPDESEVALAGLTRSIVKRLSFRGLQSQSSGWNVFSNMLLYLEGRKEPRVVTC